MLTTTISHRYARAIFGAALEENKLSRVAGDLANVLALIREDPAFLDFLVTPEVLTDGKEGFIRTVFGSWADPLTVNFMLLLMDKKRIAHLTGICEDVQQLYEEHQGLLRAEVLSAVALDAVQEARLKKELDRLSGMDVRLEKRVDPSVLGGVIVHMGKQVIDRSLRRGLRELGDRLLQAELS
jgi:F-type H+-transporting ATPase subunit delta